MGNEYRSSLCDHMVEPTAFHLHWHWGVISCTVYFAWFLFPLISDVYFVRRL